MHMLCCSLFDVELSVPEASAFSGVASTRQCAPLPACQVPILTCDNGYIELRCQGLSQAPDLCPLGLYLMYLIEYWYKFACRTG